MNASEFLINSQSRVFQPLEKVFRGAINRKKNVAPIWIVGAPRSGTTLTYQLFCRYFESYYLTNRVASRYRISLLARYAERFLINDTLIPSSFKSNFGNTKFPGDPHEGGQFFYQFFPKEDPYTEVEDLSRDQKKSFRNLIEAISSPQEMFISKNTFHSLRIQVLSDVFPGSVFVWVRRETDATVYSILKTREKLNIPDNEWWGVKPPGWEKVLDSPVIERTIWQVHETENIIETDLKKMEAAYFEVHYKQICESPMETMEDFERKFELKKHRRKTLSNIPDSFTYSELPDDPLSKKIKQALA